MVKRYTGLLLDTKPHDAPSEDTEYVLASDHDVLAAERAWQPIETAPRDGTPILCYWPNYNYSGHGPGDPSTAIAWFSENHRFNPPRGYFHDTDESDDYGLLDNTPTHWMPLPERPK